MKRQSGVGEKSKPMTTDKCSHDYRRRVMDGLSVSEAVARMADEIGRAHDKDLGRVAFVGIRTRGVYLAERLVARLHETHGVKLPCASMDITLYRDDVTVQFPPLTAGRTSIEFNVTDACIVLVDDVLFKGRTIRAALDQLIDFGRPAKIELAVLVDRGHRELPIQADYVGMKVEISLDETIQVNLVEKDRVDGVEIVPLSETDTQGAGY